MVFCSVPTCGSSSDSWDTDPSVTFHEFPSKPELAAKWVRQINYAITPKHKPMWSPRGRAGIPMICSQHFLQTDFREDSDTLRPRVIPTVFGHKYIGVNNESESQSPSSEFKRSPLIVNLIRPSDDIGLAISQSSNENENSKDIPAVPSYSENESDRASFLEEIRDFHGDSEPRSLLNKPNQPTKSLLMSNRGSASNQSLLKIGSKISYFNSHGSRSPIKFVKPDINSYVVEKRLPVIPKISLANGNMIQKRKGHKSNSKSELIEIGPNTFLKINPEIIKVNRKLTPSGNTVLQFVMDQKLANSQSAADLLPKLVHGSQVLASPQKNSDIPIPSDPNDKPPDPGEKPSPTKSNKQVVQHVLGHLVDTHVCKDSCGDLKDDEDDIDEIEDSKMDEECSDLFVNSDGPVPSTSTAMETDKTDNIKEESKDTQNILNKAPVLFTTNLPLSHCLMDKPKFISQLKQKSRQISSLKLKIASLTKKVEELEDRCIVQERQLSYSFIKQLKTIRKNANKGDSCATYILEQIRCYSGKNKMRWSDSTLSQCAVWCRKAPYAYEYFKKADFFKLPCLGTVKRFMKKHPELKFLNRTNGSNPNDNESSSDFDFDETDSEKGGQGNSDLEEEVDPAANCETVMKLPSCLATTTEPQQLVENHMIQSGNHTNFIVQTSTSEVQAVSKCTEITTFPMTVDGSSLEVQEIILPSGEVVQCYSSNICNGTDVGNQYYIIPNVDQNSGGDHEYNVVQAADSMPVILQNLENAQLPLQQEQLIFITNSADQLECTETEVSTATHS